MSTRAEQLDLFYAEFGPFVLKEDAAAIIECSEAHVLSLLDEGRLRAVDIASRKPGDGKERFLRFYRYSIIHFKSDPALPLSTVPVERILPNTGPDLMRLTIAQILKCSVDHIANLPIPVSRFGTTASKRLPRHARAALIEFLNAREVQP